MKSYCLKPGEEPDAEALERAFEVMQEIGRVPPNVTYIFDCRTGRELTLAEIRAALVKRKEPPTGSGS